MDIRTLKTKHSETIQILNKINMKKATVYKITVIFATHTEGKLKTKNTRLKKNILHWYEQSQKQRVYDTNMVV